MLGTTCPLCCPCPKKLQLGQLRAEQLWVWDVVGLGGWDGSVLFLVSMLLQVWFLSKPRYLELGYSQHTGYALSGIYEP